MFYSQKLNLLVIGIPKTGTVAVEQALLKLDSTGETHSITVGNKTYKGKDFLRGQLTHARASEIRDVIGKEYFDKLHTLTFIRNPYHKLVSAYHFAKGNKLRSTFTMHGPKKLFLRRFNYFFTTLAPKILPFQFWALIYPYRSNYDYIYDKNGVQLVKHIGRTEYLEEDLKYILDRIGIDSKLITIEKLNTSKHRDSEAYFSNRLFKYLISKRVKRDMELYKMLKL